MTQVFTPEPGQTAGEFSGDPAPALDPRVKLLHQIADDLAITLQRHDELGYLQAALRATIGELRQQAQYLETYPERPRA